MNNSESKFELEGKKYGTVQDPCGWCEGCAFNHDYGLCMLAPECVGYKRDDGRDVVFVEIGENNAN